jgi:hypothetical protein
MEDQQMGPGPRGETDLRYPYLWCHPVSWTPPKIDFLEMIQEVEDGGVVGLLMAWYVRSQYHFA